jgi:hypothetical protein
MLRVKNKNKYIGRIVHHGHLPRIIQLYVIVLCRVKLPLSLQYLCFDVHVVAYYHIIIIIFHALWFHSVVLLCGVGLVLYLYAVGACHGAVG